MIVKPARELTLISSACAIFWPGAFIFGYPGLMRQHWQQAFNVGVSAVGQTIFFILTGATCFMYLCGRWQEKYGPVPRSLQQAYARQTPRHYLLCAPDVSWEADPLREHPHDRDRLFALYQQDLERRGLPYDTIEGLEDRRFRRALQAVEKMLG